MRVFANNLIKNFAISRIEGALKRYAPSNIEFVDREKDADFVIIYAYSQRRKVDKRIKWILERGQKYAIMQIAVRATPCPQVSDWIGMWEKAEVVWTYLDLASYCEEEGQDVTFNFYHSPLGVDSKVFKETDQERFYKIIVGDSRDETVNECIEAAEGDVYMLGTGVSDKELALAYSQSEWVSGLRRKEGFEMPVIEGLMCGARPICYERDHYAQWFGDMVEYIPEDVATVQFLKNLFSHPPRPVSKKEKQIIKDIFDWKPIVEGFWSQV
jgi:hypothetical protein